MYLNGEELGLWITGWGFGVLRGVSLVVVMVVVVVGGDLDEPQTILS